MAEVEKALDDEGTPANAASAAAAADTTATSAADTTTDTDNDNDTVTDTDITVAATATAATAATAAADSATAASIDAGNDSGNNNNKSATASSSITRQSAEIKEAFRAALARYTSGDEIDASPCYLALEEAFSIPPRVLSEMDQKVRDSLMLQVMNCVEGETKQNKTTPPGQQCAYT